MKRCGRAAARKNEAKQAAAKRLCGNDRGMDIRTKTTIAGIAQNEDASKMRQKETRFATLTVLRKGKESRLDRAQKRLDCAESKGQEDEAEKIIE